MTQVAMGQTPTDTIADFLTRLGENFNIVQGDGKEYVNLK